MNTKKIYKNISIRIYYGQIKGGLYISKNIKNKNIKKEKFYSDILNIFHITIVIKKIRRQNLNQSRRRRIFNLDKVIKKAANIISKENNFNKYKNENENEILQKMNQFIINNIIYILIFICILFIFIHDYSSTKSRIYRKTFEEISEIESKYKKNKCDTEGHYPCIKEECEKLKKEIELLKLKQPTILSIISIWILDIINSCFDSFSYINISIALIIIIILIKLFKFKIL